MLKNVLARMKEPSTWAGISTILVVFGVNVEIAQGATHLLAAIAGLASVVMAERAKKEE